MLPPPPLTKYMQTRAVKGPWEITGCDSAGFTGTIVIPALAENPRLFATLASLAANPPGLLGRFLVLVVVNHREDAPEADKEDNYRTLHRLALHLPESAPLRLAWVDAATEGKELPVKKGGVGLARKIGLDLALTRLDLAADTPLLVCLDADTLVEPTYLAALLRHFGTTAAGGAAIPFRHQPAHTPEAQAAIDRYELFLRHYLLGLKIARSPYAIHTVGSAMACTTEAYLKAGGMNMRTAGEDFYFCQQLARTSGFSMVAGTTVHPSPRPSHRVPFGTGRSVYRWLGGDNDAITFYQPDCFRILGGWLELVAGSPGSEAEGIMAGAERISPFLATYLTEVSFPETWRGLRRNHPLPGRLSAAFHVWFDGLKTMKLIHHLSAHGYPRTGPEQALPGLLRLAGVTVPPAGGIREQLELLWRLEAENRADTTGQTKSAPCSLAG
jgi:Glycosyl transferase family group 2